MKNRKHSMSARMTGLGFAAAIGGAALLGAPATAQSADADAAITSHYQEVGGASSPLGEPVGAPYEIGPNGTAQDYQGGKIVYSQADGAKVMYGVILDKYLVLGGPASDIGYPTNDESDSTVAGAARFSEFSAPDGATIYWNPESGAWLVRGPIRTAWSHLGATDGVLGSPITDTTVVDGVYTQTFSGKDGTPVEVSWTKDGGFVTVPAAIAAELSGLDVSVPGLAPGSVVSGAANAPTVSVDAEASDADSDSNSKWWALPIGLAVAAGAGGLAMLAGRGNRSGGVAAPKVDAPTLKTPSADLHAPRAAADLDVKAPRLTSPNVDVTAPNVEAPNVDVKAPDLTAPNVGGISGKAAAAGVAGVAGAGVAGAAALSWLHAKGGAPDAQLDAALGGLGGVDAQNVTYVDALGSVPAGSGVDGLRFLIDENFSPQVAEGLRAQGYDAVHLRDVGADAGHNGQALLAASRGGRVLVTNELSYLDDLVASGSTAPSLLVMRRPGAKIAEQTSVIAACAPVITNALESGSLVTLDTERIRTRELPLRRN
ncbi:DUF5615 family PIN-like protein [Rhodococcus kronopolitis]|uniref:DUF5615 family PIN-like protein n=1 Tax=Rhodococcus kronopolitis TaxID=1460226 RepID=A0ABV9FUV0_9NOCA